MIYRRHVSECGVYVRLTRVRLLYPGEAQQRALPKAMTVTRRNLEYVQSWYVVRTTFKDMTSILHENLFMTLFSSLDVSVAAMNLCGTDSSQKESEL